MEFGKKISKLKAEDKATFYSFVKIKTKSKRKTWKNKGELSEVCSHIALKMLVIGTNWSTRHSVVNQQTGTICHKMDSNM